MSTGITQGNSASINSIQLVIDPANIATATTNEQTFSLPGLKLGDQVIVSKPTLTAGIAVCSARVSAADTLAITFVTTAVNINAPSETYTIVVIRPEGAPGNALPASLQV